MKIAVVGTGYVGLVTGTCFAETGNDIICVDIDKNKVDKLSSGKITIYEPGLDDLLERNISSGRLRFSTDPFESHKDVDMIFICVGTSKCRPIMRAASMAANHAAKVARPPIMRTVMAR